MATVPSTPQPAAPANTAGQSFVAQVEKQFNAQLGQNLTWTPLQKRLAMHLYVKADAAMKTANEQPNAPAQITWAQVDLVKFALAAVHIVNIGLDALIPNHVHVVYRKNNKTGKYDACIQIGYEGKRYTAMTHALKKPRDIIIRKVYATEIFVPHYKDANNEIESYSITPSPTPFSPGEVVGGYGYVVFDDPRDNFLIVVGERDFNRAKSSASTAKFWNENPDEMRYKTIIHRVCDRIALDPESVNAESIAAIKEMELDLADLTISEQAALEANGEVITLQVAEESHAAAEPAALTDTAPKAEKKRGGGVREDDPAPAEDEQPALAGKEPF